MYYSLLIKKKHLNTWEIVSGLSYLSPLLPPPPPLLLLLSHDLHHDPVGLRLLVHQQRLQALLERRRAEAVSPDISKQAKKKKQQKTLGLNYISGKSTVAMKRTSNHQKKKNHLGLNCIPNQQRIGEISIFREYIIYKKGHISHRF